MFGEEKNSIGNIILGNERTRPDFAFTKSPDSHTTTHKTFYFGCDLLSILHSNVRQR